MALVLGSATAARRARGSGGALLAGLLIALAFFTKQTTAVFAVPIAVCLSVRSPRLGLVFACAGAATGALASWAYDRATGGWFWFYVFEGHQGHRFLWRNFVLEYWRDVL